MKILKFKLSGNNAFFKKPDVNANVYFTYGNIHKVALMGMFGAILGYGGYNSMNIKNQLTKDKNNVIKFPEFYTKLNKLKISIVNNAENGYISKKVQVFNNSVGYASKEKGGNLIVNEQWLDNPSWDIYVMIDSEEAEVLSTSILNNKSIYTIYLGKNDHLADISNAKIILDNNIIIDEKFEKLDCLYLKKDFDIVTSFDEDEDFKYEENLPLALDETTNQYVLEPFIVTNMQVKKKTNINVYRINDKNIVFY